MSCGAGFLVRVALLLFVFDLPSAHLSAQVFQVDDAFGDEGYTLVGTDTSYNYGTSMALLPTNDVIVAGDYHCYFGAPPHQLCQVAKFHADGDVDSSFGAGGFARIDLGLSDFEVRKVLVRSDGRILVLVVTDYFSLLPGTVLFRLLPDGAIDSAFAVNGSVEFQFGQWAIPYSMVFDGEDVLVCGGDGGAFVVRVDSNGALVNQFGVQGVSSLPSFSNLVFEPKCIAVQNDGSIVCGGLCGDLQEEYFAVVRLLPDGSVDGSFGVGGAAISNICDAQPNDAEVVRALAIQPNGAIVAAGFSPCNYQEHSTLTVARYDPDGTLDTTFSLDGIVVSTEVVSQYYRSRGFDVLVEPTGKILVATSITGMSAMCLVRYMSDGQLDASFGNGNGVLKTMVGLETVLTNDIAKDGENNVVALGTVDSGIWPCVDCEYIMLTRYLNDFNLGIQQFQGDHLSISVWPMPLEPLSQLQYELTERQQMSLRMYSLDGAYVRSFMEGLERFPGKCSEALDVSGIAPGVYHLVLVNERGAGSSVQVMIR